MKRRDFLRTTSGLAAVGAVVSLSPSAMAIPNLIPDSSKYKDTIGLQLWTVRNQMEKDKQATMKAIADAGYKQVELGDTSTAAELVPMAKDLGMNVTSSFMNWQAICNQDEKALGVVIDEAVKADIKHLVFGYISKQHRGTADLYKKHSETANKFGEKCNAANIELCYHNHSFEFEKLDDGQTGFDIFIDQFDNDLCKFELDVFWAKIGGWDPIETLNKLNGRVTQVHLKDLIKDAKVCFDEGQVPHEAFKELGNGTIDMAEVLAVSEKIGVQQCHVEQDQSPDPIVSIGQSMAHLAKL